MRRHRPNEVVANFNRSVDANTAHVDIMRMMQEPGHLFNKITPIVRMQGTSLELSWKGNAVRKPEVEAILRSLGGTLKREITPDWS